MYPRPNFSSRKHRVLFIQTLALCLSDFGGVDLIFLLLQAHVDIRTL